VDDVADVERRTRVDVVCCLEPGAGIAGWQARSWFWTGLCPAAMLLLILLWVALFGHSSWTSAFITVLGAMFAVAATIGAVLGTWLGKRRRSPV
jgi:hypothetical protein